MKTKYIPLDPPGRILLEEFIEPAAITQKALSVATGIPYVRLNEIVHGKRRISADHAIRLATYFRTSPELWLHLQVDYDLRLTERVRGADIRGEVTVPAA